MLRKCSFYSCLLVFVLVMNISAQALYTAHTETVKNQIEVVKTDRESRGIKAYTDSNTEYNLASASNVETE